MTLKDKIYPHILGLMSGLSIISALSVVQDFLTDEPTSKTFIRTGDVFDVASENGLDLTHLRIGASKALDGGGRVVSVYNTRDLCSYLDSNPAVNRNAILGVASSINSGEKLVIIKSSMEEDWRDFCISANQSKTPIVVSSQDLKFQKGFGFAVPERETVALRSR